LGLLGYINKVKLKAMRNNLIASMCYFIHILFRSAI
jgi:hypothetical protein